MVVRNSPDTRDFRLGFKVILSFGGLDEELSTLIGDDGILVDVLAENVVLGMGDVVGCDMNDGVAGSCRFGGRRWGNVVFRGGIRIN